MRFSTRFLVVEKGARARDSQALWILRAPFPVTLTWRVAVHIRTASIAARVRDVPR